MRISVMTFVPQHAYKEILEQLPICCVDIFIIHEGKVLLVQRTNKPAQHEWWPPGGRVHKGELLEAAARRKVFEEVGLTIVIQKQLGAYETIFSDGPFDDLKSGVHTINVCFLASLTGNPDVSLDKTSSGFQWIPLSEAHLSKYAHKVLGDAGIL